MKYRKWLPEVSIDSSKRAFLLLKKKVFFSFDRLLLLLIGTVNGCFDILPLTNRRPTKSIEKTKNLNVLRT